MAYEWLEARLKLPLAPSHHRVVDTPASAVRIRTSSFSGSPRSVCKRRIHATHRERPPRALAYLALRAEAMAMAHKQKRKLLLNKRLARVRCVPRAPCEDDTCVPAIALLQMRDHKKCKAATGEGDKTVYANLTPRYQDGQRAPTGRHSARPSDAPVAGGVRRHGCTGH